VELKEFIKQSIIEISEAVKESNEHFNSKGINAFVNPEFIYESDRDKRSYTMPEKSNEIRYIEDIEFDVAVTTGGEISGEAKGGIKIASFQVGGGGSVVDKQQNVSRMKFTVPVCLPTGKYKK
jgi:hypothetical protein